MSLVKKTFDELVYPMNGRIRLEVDVQNNTISETYSNIVRVGKTDWCLKMRTECSEETNNEKYLSVYLKCCSVIGKGKIIKFTDKNRLINQQRLQEYKEKGNECEYNSDNTSWGYPIFIKWSELLAGGFVKNEKIVFECLFSIGSEEVPGQIIDFEKERPSEQELEMILKKTELPSKIESFEEEIKVSDVFKSDCHTDPITLFGLPAKLWIETYNNDTELLISFALNWRDGSDWWRCKAEVVVRLVNRNDEDSRSYGISSDLYQKTYSMHGAYFEKLNDLMDPSKGFVNDGKFKVQVSVKLLEVYGFDENTNRGIDRPMRKLTDTVLVVGGKKLYVAKDILAQQSSYFRDMFFAITGHSEFQLDHVNLEGFTRFLELVHNVDTDICEENVEEVLEMIKLYEAPECFERCDGILKKQEFEDPMKVLEWVDKYPLPGLRRKFMLKLKNEELLKSITHSDRYTMLSDSMKRAILEWMLIPEEFRTEEKESENYEFRTDFKEETYLTDIEIKVDGYSYYASRQILSNSSFFFMKRFYGPFSKEDKSISVFHVSPLHFERLLTHIYHPTRPVTSANIDTLLQLAHQFSVPMLMNKCEEYLVLNDFFSVIDKLEYAGKYDLPYLLESCLKIAKNPKNMEEIKNDPKFSYLPSHVVGELWRRQIDNLLIDF